MKIYYCEDCGRQIEPSPNIKYCDKCRKRRKALANKNWRKNNSNYNKIYLRSWKKNNKTKKIMRQQQLFEMVKLL